MTGWIGRREKNKTPFTLLCLLFLGGVNGGRPGDCGDGSNGTCDISGGDRVHCGVGNREEERRER